MVITNSVKIEKSKFFKILLVRYLKTRWPLYGSVILIATLVSQKESFDGGDEFFLILFLLYPILIVIQYWRWVNSSENKIFLTERKYEIDENKITGITDENNYSIIEKEHFIKSDIVLNTYLLYISKTQFLYFPFDAFKSIEDQKWFENNYFKQ